MTFEWSPVEKFCRVKDGRFRSRKAFRAAPCHQTHPIVLESGGATFPSAGLVGGDCGQDQGIYIIFPAGLDEYPAESARHFRVELVWIDCRKRPDIFFRGSARDLQPQCKRQYGPGSHVVLLPRKPTFWQASFFKAQGEGGRIVAACRPRFPDERNAPLSLRTANRQLTTDLRLMRRYSKRDKKRLVDERSCDLIVIDLEPLDCECGMLSEKAIGNAGVVALFAEGNLHFSNKGIVRWHDPYRFGRRHWLVGTGP
jgi:hypothetical protein